MGGALYVRLQHAIAERPTNNNLVSHKSSEPSSMLLSADQLW
jgi:hypothetical protein